MGHPSILATLKQPFVLPGTGLSRRDQLGADKGVLTVHVHQPSIPLMPLVKALGATDQQLREARGLDLREADAKHDTPAAFDKLHACFVQGG